MTANVFYACSEIRLDAGICDMIVLACLECVGIDSYHQTFSGQFVLDYRNERCRGMAVDGFSEPFLFGALINSSGCTVFFRNMNYPSGSLRFYGFVLQPLE